VDAKVIHYQKDAGDQCEQSGDPDWDGQPEKEIEAENDEE
jgi:hypothetical protein